MPPLPPPLDPPGVFDDSRIVQRLDGANQRLDGVNQRLDGTNQRLDGVNDRLDQSNQHLSDIKSNTQQTNEKLDTANNHLQSANDKLSDIDGKIGDTNTKLDDLSGLLNGSASGGDDCTAAPVCTGSEIICAQVHQSWLSRCGGLPSAGDIVDMSEDVAFQAEAELDESFAEIENQLEEGQEEITIIASENIGPIANMIEGFLPQPVECQTYDIDFPIPIGRVTFDCAKFSMFKDIYGWFLSMLVIIYIWHMAVQPVNR